MTDKEKRDIITDKVKKGIQQAKDGELVDKGSFTGASDEEMVELSKFTDGLEEKRQLTTSDGSEVGEVVRNGYKYLNLNGMIIPILDEFGNHEKHEETH